MESISFFLYCFIISFDAHLVYIMATDTMVVNQTIRDGQTIVSAQETFELGFFSPGNVSENRYLGIWYKRHGTGAVVWVANRETPIANKSGELTLDPSGVLVLRSSPANTSTIWSSTPFRATRNPVAQLMDTGNLMVVDREDGPENYIWQTFDHPGDTFLPGMKFGRNLNRGVYVVTNVTSWKSANDPSQGQYMAYMDFNGLPQIFERNEDEIQFRVGSWNGIRYTGNPSFNPKPIFTYEFVSNEREVYAIFELINHSALTRLVLSPEGRTIRWNWIDDGKGWLRYGSTPEKDYCIGYAMCGVYGSCDMMQSPLCGCLKGFTPKIRDEWDASNWTSGCRREIALDCGVGEGFRKYSSLKLPDTRQSWFDKYMTLEQCEIKCRNECNCTAYTTLDISYNIGCLLWYDELIDMRIFKENGQDIYIRVAAAELEKDKRVSKSKKKARVIFIPVIIGLTILIGLCLLIIIKRKYARERRIPLQQTNDLDLPLFSLSTLVNATNNFSFENKLGEGGFGPVYKGYLEDEQEVAVKRLSKCSLQGAEEFKNEVIFISKLQHRNLVKILGCCNEGQEKMLVYEYMPNKGLDLFLFQEIKSKTLDWSQRLNIINGIARGLVYLHQDSRLRIIHRDLKAANILLDRDMNPKISDFGMARSFRGNENETNTERVVGTYGYMSPEYAGDGIFSVKSDVFSFGVLVLEIVSGKKNRGFFHQAHNHNLLGHAWRLYQEGKSLELRDPCLTKSNDCIPEILRSIHVGLLCVQHNPDDRPNMSTVVMMLSSEGRLPEPQQPGFYSERDEFGCETSSSMQTQSSNNNVTVTVLEPR